MGSSYFGEPNLGNHERSGGQGSSSSSSRKGKKSSNSDKPKQPQRGLGVAQLEKIRLHSQMGSGYNNNIHSLQTPYIIANPNQEDIRLLQTAYSSASSSFSYTSVPSSSSHGFNGAQSIMMGLGDLEKANIRYGDSQPTTNARWNAGNIALDEQHYQQPSITRHLLNLEVEEKKKKKGRSDSMMGSGSQNSGSSGSQELDLELRLSI